MHDRSKQGVVMRIGRGVVVALAASAPETAAQQILEVDMDAGRELVGGIEYLFDSRTAAVDYDRRLVLVSEAADPLAVTAWSLDDGSVRDVFGGGRPGDGPGELAGVQATAVGPDGVFVAGFGRVLHWSWSGALLHQWRPTAPGAHAVCALNSRPAVPLHPRGLVFRGDDGESVALGGEASARLDWDRKRPDDLLSSYSAYSSTLMTCADSAAYVLHSAGHTLTEYKTRAEPRLIAMPAELAEAARKKMESSTQNAFSSGYSQLFLADDGRLVVMTKAYGLAGAVVDRATGCYALLKNKPDPPVWSYVGMFADSLVTLEGSRQPTTMVVDGKERRVFVGDETHIFVRPVRPASGVPCDPGGLAAFVEFGDLDVPAVVARRLPAEVR